MLIVAVHVNLLSAPLACTPEARQQSPAEARYSHSFPSDLTPCLFPLNNLNNLFTCPLKIKCNSSNIVEEKINKCNDSVLNSFFCDSLF